MRQVNKSVRLGWKHCLWCKELFLPDPRTKGKQRYCSKAVCQTARQRCNEKEWRKRNPDCLAQQRQQSCQWHKRHPDYSRQRRAANPELLKKNRLQTQMRMKKLRAKRMFDKSKVILRELVGNKTGKCYLSGRLKWLMIGLTKASLLSKSRFIWNNHKQSKQALSQLPKGRFYNFPAII